jgi:glycosyltransferase involved in cell wall biosynthesis
MYASSSALLATSKGEGFGLPLIEAARHDLPIIARDIPVFREIGDEHVYYFTGDSPEQLESAITEWLARDAAGNVPRSQGMPFLTWEESAQRLYAAITGSD